MLFNWQSVSVFRKPGYYFQIVLTLDAGQVGEGQGEQRRQLRQAGPLC